MLNESKLKSNKSTLVLAVLLLTVVTSCNAQLNKNGWDVTANAQKEVITITHKDLGAVVKGARLALVENGKILRLSGWSVKGNKDNLNIATIKITDKNITLDKKGKDTWKYNNAGSDLVVLRSPIVTNLIINANMDEFQICQIIRKLNNFDVIDCALPYFPPSSKYQTSKPNSSSSPNKSNGSLCLLSFS